MQPTKPSRAGQHQQQQQREKSDSRGPRPQQPKGSAAAKQTRSEIENQPPAGWEEEEEAAGGTNLGALGATTTTTTTATTTTTREADRVGTDSLASSSRRAPGPLVGRTTSAGSEGVNEPSLSCTIEFRQHSDYKQPSGEQNVKQIHPRAPGEPTKVEASEAQARSGIDDDERGSLDAQSRRQTNNNGCDPEGQIRFEQQKQRQVPSDFRDSRLDQQQQQQRQQRNSGVSTAAASSSSRATGTAVICGLVDGSSSSSSSSGSTSGSGQTAAGRPPSSSASDRSTGAPDELPVGCQKLPQPPLPPRLFNQNSSSTILSEQATSELQILPPGTNQNQKQRIKVTLSKPKQELEQEEEESRKLGEFYTQTTTINQQVAAGQCSASSSQVNFGQVRAPRRSTATLISGSSEPEVDSVEFYCGGADSHPHRQQHLNEDDARAPQEKINQIWRDRGAAPPPPPPRQDTNKQAQWASRDAGQRELELTRLERENQLRRIASQRRRAPPSASASQPASSEAAANDTTRRSVKAAARACAASDEKEKRNFLLATATSRAGQQQTPNKQQGGAGGGGGALGGDWVPNELHESQTTKIVIPERAVGQQQTNAPIKQLQAQAQPVAVVSQDPSLPSKQLAIYINGKIRSNSIFCSRSISSNSFTSILKSFQYHPSAASSCSPSGNDQQQQASESDQKLACKPNHEPQAFLTGSHNKSQAASAKELGDRRDQHAEGQPANKSFVHCLVPSRSHHTETAEDFGGGAGAGVADHLKHTRGNKRDFLAHCCDYILGSCGCATKSIGIYDTQQSQPKTGQETSQTTTGQATADPQPKTYKLNPSSMFLRKAMRYYRLWIYSANLTILLGAIIFLLSTLYVVSDHRFQLIVASSSWPPSERGPTTSTIMGAERNGSGYNNNKSRLAGQIDGDNHTKQASLTQMEPGDSQRIEQSFTISLSEPTIILAYVMIIVQLGLLQALGCFGAIQMKERLIQAFWYLILALIVMDVLILVYWLQRYDSMLRSLRDEMTSRLERQYGNYDDKLQNILISQADLGLHNSTGFDDDFTRKNSEQQQQIAHVAGDRVQIGPQFDKIFTQIFDRIQSEYQCCGVSSSLDYKHSRWREAKIAQLREQYLKQQEQHDSQSQQQNQEQLDKLLVLLPLVPASCCKKFENDQSRAHQQANVIQQQHLDDSQLPQRARVPAWSPSMVVDNLIVGYDDNLGGGQQRGPKTALASQQQRRAEAGTNDQEEEEKQQEGPTLADVIDRRWSGSRSWRHSKPSVADSSSGQYEHDWTNADDERGDGDHDKSRSQTESAADNKKTTRLLAKQMHYGGQGTSSVAAGDDDDNDEEEQEAGFVDSERPERVGRQLQRRAVAGQDNDDEDDEGGPCTGNSYDSDERDEEEPDLPRTRNELEEAKDNSNNESGRRRRQYRAENDELSSSSTSSSPSSSPSSGSAKSLAAAGLSGDPNQLLPRISNSRQDDDDDDDDESDQWAIETKLDKRGRVLARLVELATRRPDGPRKLAHSSGQAEAVVKLPEINNKLRLGLTHDQFKLIESYLTSDEIGQMTDEQLQQQQQQQQQKTPVQPGKVISRRSILSAPSAEDRDKQQQQRQPVEDAEKLAKQRVRVKQLKRLQELVANGGGGRQPRSGGPTCLPRSHYDEARIYTRGCQAHIRAWIQSSANILFVMGFCVLTVLKFCSLILLRLEIREMIHKIKVLKGMATEYNALQDLEPYLPRPSICAQAAELTSTGVTSALGVSAAGSPTAQTGQPGGLSNSANAIGQHQHQVGVAGESGGGGPLAASCSSPTAAASSYMGAPRRMGGSFSEAVAAATAVAHQQKLAEQQQQAQLARHLRHCERASSLANCAWAASTKTILGGGCSCGASLGPAGMLTAPHQAGLCPCASSLSMTAHLSHSASQSQAAPGGLSLRSDLFPPLGVAMPRRHTAVSVCPAAAAAATAAAQHLMMRRGTFTLANPLTFTSTGQQQQQQQHAFYQAQPSQQPAILKPASGGCCSAVLSAAASSANMLQAKSLNYLNQHRHSAHAVPPLLFGGNAGGMNFLNPTNRQNQQQQQARRSSNLSPSEMAAANNNTNDQLGGGGDHDSNQQPVFRRQASGGAQSAVNFSLDIAPAPGGGGQLGESRRSIY